MKYKEKQQNNQTIFRESITERGTAYFLDVNEREKNLFNWQDEDYVNSVKAYFKVNQIKWWKGRTEKDPDRNSPTCNLLSSQIACINHLFFIKHDKDAVLSVINGIKEMPTKFNDVLNIPCDKGEDNYIAFEVTTGRKEYLNEDSNKRGEFCTSIDALIYAVDENNERWLIPIEWKYIETYDRKDLSVESNPRKEPGNKEKGKTRMRRYCNIEGNNLIDNSKQLRSLPDYKHSIYFQEPFYQLMRQTLWAECICNSKDERVLPAKHFVHIHVCPRENTELLNRHYREVTAEPTMEKAWREMLVNQSLYHLIDPSDLMKPIAEKYPKLIEYLKNRYWK